MPEVFTHLRNWPPSLTSAGWMRAALVYVFMSTVVGEVMSSDICEAARIYTACAIQRYQETQLFTEGCHLSLEYALNCE